MMKNIIKHGKYQKKLTSMKKLFNQYKSLKKFNSLSEKNVNKALRLIKKKLAPFKKEEIRGNRIKNNL